MRETRSKILAISALIHANHATHATGAPTTLTVFKMEG